MSLRERLAGLVSIETPTGDGAGIAAAQDLVRGWIEPHCGAAVVEEAGGVRHLLWRGGDRPRLLLLGHIDTVFPAGTLPRRPFRIDGDVATGPGVFDMKAGIVIMAEALAMVRAPHEVAVLLTSDEEVGSLTSRSLVEREAARAGAVLVLEPSLDGAVKTTRRGGSIYRITVEGRAAHAGLDPDAGRNALIELAHQVLALPELADAQRGTTVNPTVAHAGSATNVIPDHAEVRVDVRAWSIDELERVDAAVRGLQPRTGGVRLRIDGGINRPPMEADASRGLLSLARAVAQSRGLGPIEAVAAGGASDGNFAAAVGAKTLDGLGPRGGGAHADDEWVSMASIQERIGLVAGLIDELG